MIFIIIIIVEHIQFVFLVVKSILKARVKVMGSP